MATSTLEQAVKAAGNKNRLAKLLGVSRQAIQKWSAGKPPAERVLAIEAATGVRREILRPDLYPPEDRPQGL